MVRSFKRPKPKRSAVLRPERLTTEAQRWRRAAQQARDPVDKEKFEAMAEKREIIAAAIEELETEPHADKDDTNSKP
jgi:hypothetical protein